MTKQFFFNPGCTNNDYMASNSIPEQKICRTTWRLIKALCVSRDSTMYGMENLLEGSMGAGGALESWGRCV